MHCEGPIEDTLPKSPFSDTRLTGSHATGKDQHARSRAEKNEKSERKWISAIGAVTNLDQSTPETSMNSHTVS